MPLNSKSFIIEYKRLTNSLITEIAIHPSFDPKKGNPVPPGKKFYAIWDTGATNSVITRKVVQECSLKQITVAQVHGVGGIIKDCAVYLVGIMLPNRFGVTRVHVTEGDIAGDVDVLIGMDIIALGDFAVTNHQGETAFSFRTPSKERIDFVKEHKNEQPVKPEKISRNAPCPCGSGHKYKKCCGKP